MNTVEFLQKLNTYYPSKEDNVTFNDRIKEYSNSICKYIYEHKQKFDIDKVFSKILETYRYKTFPSLPEIFDAMPYGAILPTIEESLSGREGQTITRTLHGHVYEFTVVPNSWDGIMTISELDRDIARRSARNGETITESEGF